MCGLPPPLRGLPLPRLLLALSPSSPLLALPGGENELGATGGSRIQRCRRDTAASAPASNAAAARRPLRPSCRSCSRCSRRCSLPERPRSWGPLLVLAASASPPRGELTALPGGDAPLPPTSPPWLLRRWRGERGEGGGLASTALSLKPPAGCKASSPTPAPGSAQSAGGAATAAALAGLALPPPLPGGGRQPAAIRVNSAPQATACTAAPASALTCRPTARLAVSPWPSAPDLPAGGGRRQTNQVINDSKVSSCCQPARPPACSVSQGEPSPAPKVKRRPWLSTTAAKRPPAEAARPATP